MDHWINQSAEELKPSERIVSHRKSARLVCLHFWCFMNYSSPFGNKGVFNRLVTVSSATHSVDRAILWRCLSLKGVPEEFVPLFQSLCAHNRNRVLWYGSLSLEFIKRCVVRQGCFSFAFAQTGTCLICNMPTMLY